MGRMAYPFPAFFFFRFCYNIHVFLWTMAPSSLWSEKRNSCYSQNVPCFADHKMCNLVIDWTYNQLLPVYIVDHCPYSPLPGIIGSLLIYLIKYSEGEHRYPGEKTGEDFYTNFARHRSESFCENRGGNPEITCLCLSLLMVLFSFGL